MCSTYFEFGLGTNWEARAKKAEAEVERLQAENEALTKNVHFYAKQGSDLAYENERLRVDNMDLTDACDAKDGEIERLQAYNTEVRDRAWDAEDENERLNTLRTSLAETNERLAHEVEQRRFLSAAAVDEVERLTKRVVDQEKTIASLMAQRYDGHHRVKE